MNIVICDDDDKVIKNVANVCRNVLSVKSKISAFHSAESLIQNLTNDEELVDLFILDIEMPGKNGLWLKKELEQYRYGSSIIFLTIQLLLIRKKLFPNSTSQSFKERLTNFLSVINKPFTILPVVYSIYV